MSTNCLSLLVGCVADVFSSRDTFSETILNMINVSLLFQIRGTGVLTAHGQVGINMCCADLLLMLGYLANLSSVKGQSSLTCSSSNVNEPIRCKTLN